MQHQLVSVFGLFVLLGIAWLASNNRKAIPWRTVIWGIGLQILFALLLLKTEVGYLSFRWCSDAVTKLIGFTDDGAGFVWGWLYHEGARTGKTPPIFFVDILMTIIFFSALMSLLYHIGIMQWLVAGIAKVMQKTMKTSGSETLSASANIFVGQTEAPLVVKPFVESMTMSELHAVMVGGFATVAGGVMAAYVKYGIDAGHLLVASVMSAPAALVTAKMFYPETSESLTAGTMKIKLEKASSNVFDAVCVGAADGMKLVLNVAAMLLAFVSIIALLDWALVKTLGISLSGIFGTIFAPVAWLLGIPWSDCKSVGELLGLRMAVNEFVAYMKMPEYTSLSPRAYVIATYAFCGFANFSSIAIQIGGISTMAPSRRADLAKLGLRAMLAGTLASFLTANIAGALLSDEQMERDYRKNMSRTATTVEGKLRHLDVFLEKYPDSPYGDEIRRLRESTLPAK